MSDPPHRKGAAPWNVHHYCFNFHVPKGSYQVTIRDMRDTLIRELKNRGSQAV